MRYTAEPAFVLHARPWRETSLLVEVLSASHGRVGLVARGVQGPKRHVLRAALQPLQSIRFDAVQRGELAQLAAAEAVDATPLLLGDAVMAGFYLNELCLRLAPRLAPQPELHLAYAQARERLRAGEPLAWLLRRFERDLLDAQGVGFDWQCDGDGSDIDPAARYRLEAEHGPRRVLGERAGERRETATGLALLALAADRMPPAADLASLRVPMRAVLLHHLGGRGLASWDMLGTLARLVREKEPGEAGPGEAKPGEAKPGEAKPGEAKPGEAKPGEAKPGEAKPGEAKPGEAKPGEAKPGEAKPGEAKPGEAKPG